MPNPIEHRTASQLERKPWPAPSRNLLIPPPSSPVVFCAWPICPISRSTGSAGMKRYFGAKSVKFCLPSRHLSAENQKTEGADSLLAAGEHCRTMDPTAIELRSIHLGERCRIWPGRGGRASDPKKSSLAKIGFVSSTVAVSLALMPRSLAASRMDTVTISVTIDCNGTVATPRPVSTMEARALTALRSTHRERL
jgi:hypothetical protein